MLVRTFLFSHGVDFFSPQPVSELVALLAELGEKVKALEQDLEMTKANLSRNVEELAKSHEERRALKRELDQIHNAAQLVVSEVFGSAPSTSAPVVQLGGDVPPKSGLHHHL